MTLTVANIRTHQLSLDAGKLHTNYPYKN